jgi:hypothetical protein
MQIPNGAGLLKVLRDRKANDLESLCRYYEMDPGAAFYITHVLDDLRRAGLVTTDPAARIGWVDTKIIVTPELAEVQHALGISLSQAASASADTISVTPYFGRPLPMDEAIDVFVVMPFAEKLAPVYCDHIKRVAGSLSLSVKRAKDFFSAHHVMADVWRAICGAQLVIADCTGKNPNVFYEIGMAHTVGKPVILITQKREHVPFDLQDTRYITYDYTPPGMTKFEAELTQTLRTELKITATETSA